jgi:hypothetical protein
MALLLWIDCALFGNILLMFLSSWQLVLALIDSDVILSVQQIALLFGFAGQY